MKWCFIFSLSFLLITSNMQSGEAPKKAAVLNLAFSKSVADGRGVNRALVRAQSCELPTKSNGGMISLDVKRLQEKEHPTPTATFAYKNGFEHPGKKLATRAESPKGSPRDPSKLQHSKNEQDLLPEEESFEQQQVCPTEQQHECPAVISQRRATFSE